MTYSALGIVGYSNRMSASAGKRIDFKVSTNAKCAFEARLQRVLYADPNPEGPGLLFEDLSHVFSGRFTGAPQRIPSGSYAIVNVESGIAAECITLAARIWPTLPSAGKQTIMFLANAENNQHIELGIDGDHGIYARLPSVTDIVKSEYKLHARVWYDVWLGCDAETGSVSLGIAPCYPEYGDSVEVICQTELSFSESFEWSEIRIAAAAEYEDFFWATRHFNGKIEAPRIFEGLVELPYRNDETIIAHWDFSKGIDTQIISDIGPHNLDGRLVNIPTRAKTGSNWSGAHMNWQSKPDEYGAIHFHQDDLYSCEWKTSFAFIIPDDLPSGAYVVHVESEKCSDKIPFYVTPAAQAKPRADIVVVIPVFTYIAYGNHARQATDATYLERASTWGAPLVTPDTNPEFGLSTYNVHADGSGICMVSGQRPLLNMRPGYITFVGDKVGSGVHHYAADFYITRWLEHLGLEFDVLTDQELHDHGKATLSDYRVVLTTSHPEYQTLNSLNAFQDFVDGGGNLIYLGGNGFYWRIAASDDMPSLIELRRNENGIRAWASLPGEYYHALDGGYGGLWRANGRAPQALTGVGFVAQGEFESVSYKRTAASYDAENQWMFRGIVDDILGDFGYAGGGAAGYELDRADVELGTPRSASILARSSASHQNMNMVPEEILWENRTISDQHAKKIMSSDIVIFKNRAGGRVFSTGSITYSSALPWNNFNNNISRLTENVLRDFLEPSKGGLLQISSR